MESLNSSLNAKSAENLAQMIVDNSTIIDAYLLMLDKNPDWIEDNICGEISCTTLLEALVASYCNEKCCKLLISMIEIIDGNVIDDMIFDAILCHPDNIIREQLLISLAHKKLKENQLRCLCNIGIGFECHFELAILYYTENLYTLEKLSNFIDEVFKSKYSYIMEELIVELANHHVASNKEKNKYIVDLLLSQKILNGSLDSSDEDPQG